MEEKLPVYELKIEDDWSMGAISFVDAPANESNFLAFDKQKIKMSEVVKDKQEVIGVVLIPNQMIFRQDQSGYQYQVFFSEETIKELSRQYLKNMWGNADTTLQHDLQVRDTTLLESWITGETDKAKGLGFDVPAGSWMIHFKVNSPTVWKEVQAKLANGFSIEAWMDLVPTELAKQDNTEESDITDDEAIEVIKKLLKEY